MALIGITSTNVEYVEPDKSSYALENSVIQESEIKQFHEEDSSNKQARCLGSIEDSYEDNDQVNDISAKSQLKFGAEDSSGWKSISVNATIHRTTWLCGRNIDVDFYEFEVRKTSNVQITLSNIPTGVDYDLFVYDENHNLVGQSIRASYADEYVWKQLKPAVYYVKVNSYSGYSNTEEYNLSIRANEKELKTYTHSEMIDNFGDYAMWTPNYSTVDYWSVAYYNDDFTKVYGPDVYKLYKNIGHSETYQGTRIYLLNEETAESGFRKMLSEAVYIKDALESEKDNIINGDDFVYQIVAEVGSDIACAALTAPFGFLFGTITCTAVGYGTNLVVSDPYSISSVDAAVENLGNLSSKLAEYGRGDYVKPLVIDSTFEIKLAYGVSSSIATSVNYYKSYEYDVYELIEPYEDLEYVENIGNFGGTFGPFKNTANGSGVNIGDVTDIDVGNKNPGAGCRALAC